MLIFWSSYGVGYNAPTLSATSFFTLLIGIAAALLPFFLGLLTNDFWILSGTLYEKPSIVFRKEAILILSTSSVTGFIDPGKPNKLAGSNTLFWSSLPWVNEVRSGVNRVPVFQVSSVDENLDGLTDLFDISITVPLFSCSETITKAQIILFFDVEFRKGTKLMMQSPIFLEHKSQVPGQKWKVQGDIKFRQRNLISATGVRTIYDYSLFQEEKDKVDGSGISQWATLVQQAFSRNESLLVEPRIDSWQSMKPEPRNLGVPTGTSAIPFTIDLSLRVPVQKINYAPSLGQVLKQGWVQYFSIFCLTAGFFYTLVSFLIKSRILATTVSVSAPTLQSGESMFGAPWKKFPTSS